MEPEAPVSTPFHLSSLVASPSDVMRLRRELDALDDYLRAQALRQTGAPMPQLPKLSRMLDELVVSNKINLLYEDQRRHLAGMLAQLHSHAPVLHISFASDPSSGTLQKIVIWLRQHVDPQILVHVGLQPSIVAGCTVRTTNRYFDLSLRKHLDAQRAFLLDALTPHREPEPTEAPHE